MKILKWLTFLAHAALYGLPSIVTSRDWWHFAYVYFFGKSEHRKQQHGNMKSQSRWNRGRKELKPNH